MQSSIWKIRGFLPYIVVVFLNAFTDLGHKIVIQNTVFKIYNGETQIVLTAIVNALILLPFILLFTPSGFLSDRYPKSYILRLLAGVAVAITLLITLCYYMGWFELAFGFTFLLALQSAIYSPAKYGYIKELVGERYITMGNGVVQAITTTAILGGILLYSILFESYLDGVNYADSSDILKHIAPIGWLLVGGSVVEFLLAYRLPNTHIDSHHRFDLGRYIRGDYLRKNISLLREKEVIFYSILGLSLFWGVSQVVLSSFPEYAKDTLGVTNTVLVQGMMAIAGIGIVIGSLIAGKMSKYYIAIGSIPLGAMGISLALLMLPMISSPYWHMVNFFMFGVSSGLFIVPLNALIQYHSRVHELGMILAGNNYIQNIVMFTFLMMTVLFAIFGLESIGLFYLMLLFSGVATIWLLRYMPENLLQFITLSIASVRYRVEALNIDNFPKDGAVLMLGNHISWIDWILVQMVIPRRIRFVMDKGIYERWYLKPFFKLFGAVPISPRAIKGAKLSIARLLKDGEVVCLFPEGTISRNGQLSSFKRGFEKMVEGSEGEIVPFYLYGLWGDGLSRASRHHKKLRWRLKRDIIINFGKPMSIDSRATQVKKEIYKLGYLSGLEYRKYRPAIAQEWIEVAKRFGGDTVAIEFSKDAISHRRLLIESILYSQKIDESSSGTVGILLPPSIDGVTLLLASKISSAPSIVLDPTVSSDKFADILQKDNIEQVYTKESYITKLKAKGIDMDTLLSGTEILYIEQIDIAKVDRVVVGIATSILPSILLKKIYAKDRDEVDELSEIVAFQDMLNLTEDDTILSTLPLSCETISMATILSGRPVVYTSDSSNPKSVGRAALRHSSTLLLTNSQLLDIYSSSDMLEPLHFGSMKRAIVFDDVDDDRVLAYEAKFMSRLYRGYRLPDLSTIITMNIPNIMESIEFTTQIGEKRDSLGMPMSNILLLIVDGESLEPLMCDKVGVLLIAGVVAKDSDIRYMIGEIEYIDTKMKASIDSDGFLYLKS
ncbi:Putative 2-acylglycerophosphoethanolamine acyltransferase / acyl-acyl carrier protein synthetase [hydrothermal vent metagenome]|uniref:Putative 2-acylglycerophosphoethanolamine acyltransferase / acyl-acyl carrier protein synthetase n=1 Tax=hydrothermal vent metagenome TaxID=652676 RepID=A0A1W1CFY3_9ZZZZ